MVDSSKLPNHVEAPKADEEFESKCYKMSLGLFTRRLDFVVYEQQRP